MSFALDGLVSGLSTSDLISQLIQLERQPQMRLAQKRDGAQRIIQVLQGLNTKLSAVRGAGRLMADPKIWDSKKATSSNDAVVTTTAEATALAGSLTFNVTTLAVAGSMASSGTVSSLSDVVTSSALLMGATDPTPLGISSITGSGALVTGEHTITVTQASAAATKTGTAPLAASTTISNGANTLAMTVNGVAQTWTIAPGTYDATQLAAAVQSAATAAGAQVAVDVDPAGALRIRTLAEGSAASLQLTGGAARNSLSLAVDAAAIVGVDGVVDVDGQVHTITDARAGVSTTLASGTGGSFTLSLSGGLRTGTWTATALSSGDGTLAGVVKAINDSDLGISAAAVQVSPGQYRLQLTARETGTAADITLASDTFASGPLGSLLRTATATDATITVGNGPGAYTITSATNVVKDALPGVTLTLKSTGTATVTVDNDVDRLTKGIKGLVEQANAALTEIKALTAYDPEKKQAAILLGNQAVRLLQSRLVEAVNHVVPQSALGSAGLAGVSVAKDGKLTFDEAKFVAAFNADPQAVAALFSRSTDSTDARVEVMATGDRTVAGTYAVSVTQAAAQAEATGTAPAGGTLAGPETIEVRVGATVASFSAAGGATIADVAAGLNAAMEAAKLGVTAAVEGGALVLRSTSHGAGATFDVRSSAAGAGTTGIVAAAGAWESHAGLDVAGTINGVAASGSGQLLTAPATDASLAGVVIKVTATTAEVTGATAVGSITIADGVAQRLASVGSAAIDTVSGSLTAIIEGRKTEVERLNGQIAEWDVRIEQRRLALRRKFTAMETAMSAAKAQQSWLAGQLAGLPNQGGS